MTTEEFAQEAALILLKNEQHPDTIGAAVKRTITQALQAIDEIEKAKEAKAFAQDDHMKRRCLKCDVFYEIRVIGYGPGKSLSINAPFCPFCGRKYK